MDFISISHLFASFLWDHWLQFHCHFFLFIVLPISGTESYFVRCKKTFEGIQHVRIFFLFFRGIVSSTLYNETKPNSFICGLA